MRYLLAVIASQSRPVAASPGEMAEIDAFNDKIQEIGRAHV